MYAENEILVTTEDIGKKENGTLIPKGTVVEFIKVLDSDDLTKSLIAIKLEDRVLVTLETNVKIKNWWKRRKAFKAFNNQMMINNPRYRRYHPNVFMRTYFKLFYFIKDKFGGNNE